MPNKPKAIRPPWVPERVAFGGRSRDHSKFYNGRKWRKFATAFRLKNPLCIKCEAEGRITAVAVCDHIRGLDFLLDNNIDPIQESEVQSLCHKCHNSKSGKESHGIRENIKK